MPFLRHDSLAQPPSSAQALQHTPRAAIFALAVNYALAPATSCQGAAANPLGAWICLTAHDVKCSNVRCCNYVSHYGLHLAIGQDKWGVGEAPGSPGKHAQRGSRHALERACSCSAAGPCAAAAGASPAAPAHLWLLAGIQPTAGPLLGQLLRTHRPEGGQQQGEEGGDHDGAGGMQVQHVEHAGHGGRRLLCLLLLLSGALRLGGARSLRRDLQW